MKNIFSVFGTQNTTTQDNIAFDLDEQDLEQVNGASGGGYCYDDDDSCDYDDDDYCHRHHHHRHHHHHHC